MKKKIEILALLFSAQLLAQTPFEVKEGITVVNDVQNNISYTFSTAPLNDIMVIDKGNLNYEESWTNIFSIFSNTKSVKYKGKIGEFEKTNYSGFVGIEKDHYMVNCLPVDAFLGAGVMKKHILHFDNKNKQYNVLKQLPQNIESYTKMKIGKNSIFTNGLYTLELSINGKTEEFIIHTGLPMTITTKNKSILNKHIEDLDTHRAFHTKNNNKIRHTFSLYDNNEIAYEGIKLKQTEVLHSDENFVGNGFFLNFEEVIFDLSNKAIYVKNETNEHKNHFADIMLSVDENSDIYIFSLTQSSDYYKNGLRVFDKVKLQDKNLEKQLKADKCNFINIIEDYIKQNSKIVMTKM